MITLRPYQTECVEAISSYYKKGIYRQLVSLPTASGKTVIFASLIARMNLRALVIVTSIEILNQTIEKFNMIAPNLSIGVINAEKKQFDKDVTITTFQSAIQENTAKELSNQKFQILVADECHHRATDASRELLNALGFGSQTNKLLIGFTATAFRSDGKGLGEVFDKIVFERSTKDMIADGWLVKPFALKIKTDLDLTKVEQSSGDFEAKSLASVMDTVQINNLVVSTYQEKAFGRKTIVFCVNVQHAHNLTKKFQAQGISASVIHGEMLKPERDSIITAFKDGRIQVLVNCQILTEGFDVPETDCIIVARPTKSRGLYTQMVGRGLRLFPNKRDCIIFDFDDTNHSICNAAGLYKDLDVSNKQSKKDRKALEKRLRIPVKLNQELKNVLVQFDPLGKSFAWEKMDKTFVMQGNDGVRLAIQPESENRYRVVFSTDLQEMTIAKDLSFEYAFGTAEAFAKKHKKYFVLHDLEADWRNQPITQKQLNMFKGKGFRTGVKDLTKGQASLLIRSGVLNRIVSNV